MKKMRWTAILLTLVLGLALTACGGATESDDDMTIPNRFPDKYYNTAWRTETEGEYLLGDYESEFEYLFLGFDWQGSEFGTLRISDEQATRGSHSLKITVYGDGKFNPADSELVYFRIDTSCEYGYAADSQYEFGSAVEMINDFTPYSCIRFDFYNAMEESANIRFYMQDLSFFHSFSAEPGWNSVTVPLDGGVARRQSDGTLNDMTQITKFGFVFEKYEEYGHLQTYYLDNLRACV